MTNIYESQNGQADFYCGEKLEPIGNIFRQ